MHCENSLFSHGDQVTCKTNMIERHLANHIFLNFHYKEATFIL